VEAYQPVFTRNAPKPAFAGNTSAVVGTSTPIREVERALGWLAAAEVNLLLQGEPGTGKRVLAETIHLQSPRGAGRFHAVSLANRTESQIEPDLFGAQGERLLGDAH